MYLKKSNALKKIKIIIIKKSLTDMKGGGGRKDMLEVDFFCCCSCTLEPKIVK